MDGKQNALKGSKNRSNRIDGVTCILPAFNESSSIENVLTELWKILESLNFPFEIIVVDDASTDNTNELAKKQSFCKVIRHHENKGYGASLKTGIRNAAYDTVCIMDADGTYPIDVIPELLQHMETGDYDMVVGARTKNNPAIPLIRRPAKWAITKFAKIVSGENIPDLNSGMRVFKRDVVHQFFAMLPDGFSFTSTITLGMLSNGYEVKFVPIEYFSRMGKSKIRPIRDTIRFFQLILRITLYFSPLKIYLPLSVIVFFLGICWGVISYLLFGRIADASTAVVLMAAFQIAVVGLLADLINRRLTNFRKPLHKRDEG